MPAREVGVLHVLFPRRIGGETQVLLYKHPKWRRAEGAPMLALPTTALAEPAADTVRAGIGSVLATDLKLPEVVPHGWRPFADVNEHAVSPTKGVPSAYHIRPVLSRLPAVTHARAVTRAEACWLSPRAALARADLSPTARAVLSRVRSEELLPPLPPAEEHEGSALAPRIAARLAAARDGDMNEFALVVRELEPQFVARLRRSATTRALRPHDLEDAVADGFAHALEHLEGFDPWLGSGPGWLWTIARNAAVDRLRRTGRAGALPPETADPRTDRSDPTEELVASEELALHRARVEAALQQVPPKLRTAWALWAADEMTYDEIAAKLRVPRGTVATWVSRIRQLALAALPQPNC